MKLWVYKSGLEIVTGISSKRVVYEMGVQGWSSIWAQKGGPYIRCQSCMDWVK